MPARVLIEAWVALVVLSAGTTVMTLLEVTGPARTLIAAGVLGLAGLKARVILARYLGLRQTRFWTRMFDAAIAAFLTIAFSLYLFGTRG